MSDTQRQPLLRNEASPIPPYNPASAPPDYHASNHSHQHSYHNQNIQAVPLPIAHPTYPTNTHQPACIGGQPHAIRTDLTLSGVLCGILLFPIGLACMLTWLQRRCTKCGMRFQ